MKCCMCKRTIRSKETRMYTLLGKRKVYSCMGCDKQFSEMLDKRSKDAVDGNRSDSQS